MGFSLKVTCHTALPNGARGGKAAVVQAANLLKMPPALVYRQAQM